MVVTQHKTHLKAGDKAPKFSAKDQDGKGISLKDFAGKKLVLYFYPKDNTPGCTAEACNLRDNYNLLLKKGYAVIGVSANNEKDHKKFIKKFNLPFPLIADTEKEVCNAYGVWGKKKFMGREFMGIVRTTFIISEKGIIEEVIEKVDNENHTSQILK
ncbi:MAG: Peroxiredoxin Bcp [Bacteroidia bacterium]|nr:Peroxiredoxin Bcp [Bacteroidia bacterium]